jgi:hypothetical protein
MLGVLVTRAVFLLMEGTPILMVMGPKVGSDENLLLSPNLTRR